jgi:uncharacterized membrane protein YcaP (DUF421 family)
VPSLVVAADSHAGDLTAPINPIADGATAAHPALGAAMDPMTPHRLDVQRREHVAVALSSTRCQAPAMTSVEITSSWSQFGFVLLSAGAMLTGIIFYVRVIGLRSFSKMSSFDFAVTVAMGSLLAAVTLSGSSLADGLVAAGALLLVQAAVAYGRIRFGASAVVDNDALLLMAGSTMLEGNLRRARVTADDVRAKLRQANIQRYDQVRYVVLETTGDVTVVQGEGELERDILADVVDAELLFDS